MSSVSSGSSLGGEAGEGIDFNVTTRFSRDSECTTPSFIEIDNSAEADDVTCEVSADPDVCASIDDGSKDYQTQQCIADSSILLIREFIAAKWASQDDYFVFEQYRGLDCASHWLTIAHRGYDSCQLGFRDQSVYTTDLSNGSVSVRIFDSTECGGEPARSRTFPAEYFETGACLNGQDTGNSYIALSRASLLESISSSSGSASSGTGSNDPIVDVTPAPTPTPTPPEPDSGISVGAIVGIIAGVLVVLTVLLFWYCRRRRQSSSKSTPNATALLEERGTTGTASTPRGRTKDGEALWEDEAIVSSRVPREKVIVQTLVSRGGFGEVYRGTFNGRDVAIKMLLPEARRSLKHVNAFLAEVKLMASLDHTCIVAFVGVAWDSLNDLCVLSEFMAGGDLRTLLEHYLATNHPVGIDDDKLEMAVQIAHALTYLHSLQQPVIHRDLKSRNVLLSEQLNAKLTDFGVAREREDTMTAGVGTSLWMAPEVMLGGKYGIKADIFSFGVLLAELDQHSLPYAQQRARDKRKIPDAVVLQMVATGALRVEFSRQTPQSIVDIGLECVSTDPERRPTAAQLMYRLQTARR